MLGISCFNFQVSTFRILNFQMFECIIFKMSNVPFANFQIPSSIFQIFKISKSTIPKNIGTQSFQTSHNCRFSYMKITYFKQVPIFSCIFLKYFGESYGVRGSRIDHIFGRSKNVPKSIAIDQESLISHFGIILNLLKPFKIH